MNAVRTHRASPDASATERARSQKGNALVEFAFVLPLFLFLVFGMIMFSIALYDKTILTMATRDGARAGAVFAGTNTAKEKKAQDTADAYIGNLITFGTPPGSSPFVAKITGGIITVTATYVYTGLPSPYDDYILPTTINLTAETNMIVE